jgi:hypothetical protein
MPVNRQAPTPYAEALIGKAEGGKHARWQRGNRTQITLRIAPRLLERLDAVARERETTGAVLIALWLRDKLDELEATGWPAPAPPKGWLNGRISMAWTQVSRGQLRCRSTCANDPGIHRPHVDGARPRF